MTARPSDTALIRPRDPLVALLLLTRLPLPAQPDAAFGRQARAVWAFPLAGTLVGLLAGATGALALGLGLPAPVAAALMLAAQIMVTGAMHEDGLADSADGLWGGDTAERRLAIMRDSHIGSYGVLALILSLALRGTALSALVAAGQVWTAPLAAAVLSRAMMTALMAALPHARRDGLAHGVGRPGAAPALIALLLALLVVLPVSGSGALIAALAAAVPLIGFGLLARARIGGQSGDILGAGQQIAEIAVLLALLALS